jgi:hypothetical protein
MIHDGLLGPSGVLVIDDNLLKSVSGRLTYQVNAKNKLAVYYFNNPRFVRYFSLLNLGFRPEAARRFLTDAYVWNGKWTWTANNKLLVEAGYSPVLQKLSFGPHPGARTPADNPPYGDLPKCDVVRAICWNAINVNAVTPLVRQAAVASMSYITGGHAFKAGYQYSHTYNEADRWSYADGIQQYTNGVPFAFDAFNTPITDARQDAGDLGLFAQDTWTFTRRLTINPGLRWDRFRGWVPEQSFPAGRFVPARTFARIDNTPDWSDFSLRLGVAYDLSGDGRTALKASLGKFVLHHTAGGLPAQFNPANFNATGVPSDRRNWTDFNGDDIAQDGEIGPSRDPSFGVRPRNLDLEPGFKREYDLLYNVTIERELRSNVGVGFAYIRRDARNTKWTDNVTQVSDDYELFTVADPRANGQTLPVWHLRATRLGPVAEVIRNSDSNRLMYQGVDAIVRARLTNGTVLAGGTSTGQLRSQMCEVENPNAMRFCDQRQFDVPYLTTLKLSGTYPLPWSGLRVGVVFQSRPGTERVHSYTVTRAQLPQLTTVSSVSVRLNEPGSLYLDRINQLDVSVAGTLALGRKVRVRPQLELFNLLNVSPVLTERTQFPFQGTPQRILNGRLIRLGMQVEY